LLREQIAGGFRVSNVLRLLENLALKYIDNAAVISF